MFDPSDIYSKEFKQKLGFMGYDPEDVNDFLDVIGSYYEELLLERNKLNNKIEKLEEEVKTYRNMEDSLEKTIKFGKKAAEDKKDTAQQEASVIIKEAEVKAEEIINRAKTKQEKMIREAEQKKEKILKEAQDNVEDKYKTYQELVEKEKLFKIRFETLLKSHLEMLNTEDEDLAELKEKIEGVKKE